MKLVPAERSMKAVSMRSWMLVAVLALLFVLMCGLAGCGQNAADSAENQDGTEATEQTANGAEAAAESQDGAGTDKTDKADKKAKSDQKADAQNGGAEADGEKTDGGKTSDDAVQMSDMVGYWVLYEVQSKDEAMTLSPDEVELYAKGGYNITLTLKVDGKAEFSHYGQDMEGTWEFTSGSAGTLTLSEVIPEAGAIDPEQAELEAQGPKTATINFKYEDGKLHLTGPNKETEVLVLAD